MVTIRWILTLPKPRSRRSSLGERRLKRLPMRLIVESAVKKPKSASARKKKVAHRNNLSQIKAPASEAAPPPAQNDISTPAAEQTGTLAFGDRLVAFASSAGDDNDVGLSVANYVGTPGEPASVLAVGNATARKH